MVRSFAMSLRGAPNLTLSDVKVYEPGGLLEDIRDRVKEFMVKHNEEYPAKKVTEDMIQARFVVLLSSVSTKCSAPNTNFDGCSQGIVPLESLNEAQGRAEESSTNVGWAVVPLNCGLETMSPTSFPGASTSTLM